MKWSRTVLRTALTTRGSRGIPRRMEVISVSDIRWRRTRLGGHRRARSEDFAPTPPSLAKTAAATGERRQFRKSRNSLDHFDSDIGVVTFVGYDKPRLPPGRFAQPKSLWILNDLD